MKNLEPHEASESLQVIWSSVGVHASLYVDWRDSIPQVNKIQMSTLRLRPPGRGIAEATAVLWVFYIEQHQHA